MASEQQLLCNLFCCACYLQPLFDEAFVTFLTKDMSHGSAIMQQAVAGCMADARMAEAKAKRLQTSQVQLNTSMAELAELKTTPGDEAAVHGKSQFL